MARILVSGCSGFLASYLIENLSKGDEHQIFGFTEIPNFSRHSLSSFQVDIRDREQVFTLVKKVKPDLIFHLAAIANVGFSWKNQKLTHEVNFIGSSNLMEAIGTYAPRARTLIMGTAEVYKENGAELINEQGSIEIKNPYSLSKMAMEMAADLFINTRNLNIIKIRCFNFTGPGQDRKFVASDFARQIAKIEIGQKEPQIRVGNLSAVRDFSDVRDIARYLLTISQKGPQGGLYNLCSGTACSIEEILRILLSLTDKEITVVVDKKKFRPVDTPRLVGDPARIHKQFGLKPEFNIKQTLSHLLEDWRKKMTSKYSL